MKKSVFITILTVTLVLAVSLAVFISVDQKNKFAKEVEQVKSQENQVQSKIDTLKDLKDQNNYLPVDVVRYFLVEVKAGSFDKAKLYVGKENQAKDIKTWLNLNKAESDLTLENIDYSEENSEKVTVETTIKFSDDSSLIRKFGLVKEDSIWKIGEIKGE